MKKGFLVLILWLILVHPAQARLNVVVTLPWIGVWPNRSLRIRSI